MKKVAIVQSNYIPWKGYFDLINSVDAFVIYDEVQYTKGDWRNRNKIKTPQGAKWITLPINCSGKGFEPISEKFIADERWGENHWKIIYQNYFRTKYFDVYKDSLKEAMLTAGCHLSSVNKKLIHYVCEHLNINTPIYDSSVFLQKGGKTERLVNICKDLYADIYLSGPAAQGYLEVELFEEVGMRVEWMDYTGYPVYTQLSPPFEHAVSILDLLFNEGPEAHRYMLSFDEKNSK